MTAESTSSSLATSNMQPMQDVVASPNHQQPPTPISAANHLIPESLLALAKDVRYIQQCQELLSHFWTSFLELIGQENHASSEVTSLQEQTWILSYALYTIFVVAPLGKTLGMQALGLAFGGGEKSENGQTQNTSSIHKHPFNKMVRSMLFACATGFAMECYHCYYKRIHNSRQNMQNLQGRSHREIHEQMRQRMLARASNVSNSANTDDRPTASTSAPANASAALSLSQRFQSALCSISNSVLNMAFHREGPHEVTDANVGNTVNRTTAYSMAIWLLRLHLAQYLVTGKFPTILHRMLGLKLNRDDGNGNNPQSAIPFRPNSQKAIALLILIQASSTAIRNSINWLAQLVAMYLEKRRRVAASRGKGLSPEAELQNALVGFFNDGSLEMIQERDEEAEGSDKDGAAVDDTKTATNCTLCTICRTERKHPAAPVSCGHVCCWNCLNQWVINVRPECPLCRAPCNPQEIIPLYGYQPAEEADGSDVLH